MCLDTLEITFSKEDAERRGEAELPQSTWTCDLETDKAKKKPAIPSAAAAWEPAGSKKTPGQHWWPWLQAIGGLATVPSAVASCTD